MPTKVKFLQDFQGVETNGVFYLKDQLVELADNLVSKLVQDKRVELVKKSHYGAQPEPELRHDEDLYQAQNETPAPEVETPKRKRGRQ